MHDALINILKFFLSYTTQLVSKYNKISSRLYGIKNLRGTVISREDIGSSKFELIPVTIVDSKQKTLEKIEMTLSDGLIRPASEETIERVFLPLASINSFGCGDGEGSLRFYDMFSFGCEIVDDETHEAKVFPTFEPIDAFVYGNMVSLFELYGQQLVMSLTPKSFSSKATFGLTPIDGNSVSIKVKTGE